LDIHDIEDTVSNSDQINTLTPGGLKYLYLIGNGNVKCRFILRVSL